MIMMSHFSCRKEPQVFHFFDYDFYKETMAYTGFRSKSPIHTESFHKRGSMHIVAKPIKLDWLNFRKMSISTTDIDCMWKKAYILRENHYHLKKKKKKKRLSRQGCQKQGKSEKLSQARET